MTTTGVIYVFVILTIVAVLEFVTVLLCKSIITLVKSLHIFFDKLIEILKERWN